MSIAAIPTNHRTFPEIIGNGGVFNDGDWVESKDQDPKGDVRLVQLADVGFGEWINKSARSMTSQKAKDLSCTYLVPGDILIARMPDPIGRACIFPGDPMPCVTVVDVCILRPDPKIADAKYLVRMINSPRFQHSICRWVTGTTRQRISRGNLAKLPFELPPLPEQKRIAAILDKADAVRRKRQQAIQLTEQFLRSTFQEMFGDPVTNPKGWPVEPLKRLVRDDDKVNYGVVQPGGDYPGGIPVIRVGDFASMSVDTSNLKTIDPSIAANYKRSRLHGDEILVACVGSIGLVAVADERFRGFNIVRAVARVRCGPQINRLFLACCLSTPSVQAYFTSETRTVAQPTLNIRQIEETKLILPPLEKQRRFADVFDKHLELVANSRRDQKEMDNLFDSLVQRAFRGEL